MLNFSKSLNLRNIGKSVSDIRFRIRFQFESSFWIFVSGCKLTILPDIQPANRIMIISERHPEQRFPFISSPWKPIIFVCGFAFDLLFLLCAQFSCVEWFFSFWFLLYMCVDMLSALRPTTRGGQPGNCLVMKVQQQVTIILAPRKYQLILALPAVTFLSGKRLLRQRFRCIGFWLFCSCTGTNANQRWPESHFQVAGVTLRLRSCSKIFESGSENFSHLRIRLLFRLRLPSMQPKFSKFFT